MSKIKNEGRVIKKLGKTPYGSTSDMIVSSDEYGPVPVGYVLCKDEMGIYITPKSRIDNGLADPNRWSR